MAYNFDIEAAIKVIIRNLLQVEISFILYINLKFLYNCIMKFSTTQGKKHIIIEVKSFC